MKDSYANIFHIKKELSDITSNDRSNLDGSKTDKVFKKIDKLTKNVLSKHLSLNNKQKRILKEKRLNKIFNKSNYYNIYNEIKSKNKNNKKVKKNTISFLLNDNANNNFLEKYKDLYGLTMNNRNIDYNNKPITYYLNKLKNNNKIYSYRDSKINNISNKNNNIKNIFNFSNSIDKNKRSHSLSKSNLKKKCESIRNEIFGNLGRKKIIIPNFNLSIKSNMIKNNNLKNGIINDNTLNFNKTTTPRNLTYNSINNQNSKNIINNIVEYTNRLNSPKISKTVSRAEQIEPYISTKQIQFNHKSGKLNQKNYYNYYSYKPQSIISKMKKKKYFNYLYKNVSSRDIKKYEIIDSEKFLFNQPKERLDYKLNSFKTRLNLLSMK